MITQFKQDAQLLQQLESSLYAHYLQMKLSYQGGQTEESDHSKLKVHPLFGKSIMPTKMELQPFA
jgi:hypothetical protein